MLLVDYVVAHDAVHLEHRNQMRTYWAEFGHSVENVERFRAELRRRGSDMLW
jgi:predicted metal-dependent hydrolase